MNEGFKTTPEPKITSPETQEKIETLSRLFDEAEVAFEAGGREATKPLLEELYSSLGRLNRPNPDTAKLAEIQRCITAGDFENIPDLSPDEINPLANWNPEGDLSEDQFNTLNLRRKKLSNAVGIMTNSGEVRHNLNEI